MNRRDFLKTSIAMTAGTALPVTINTDKLFAATTEIKSDYPDITVCKSKDRVAATKKAIEMIGGIERFVKKGDKVVIKPNMSFNATPEEAANTHPDVVATVTELCKNAGASKIMVIDHIFSSNGAELSGIHDACNKIWPGCVQVIQSSNLYKEVDIPGGKILKSTMIAKAVLECDVHIAIAKTKSHSSTGISGSVKGNMGLIYSRSPFHSYGVSTCLADLLSVLKPTFAVMDSTNVMTTNGPYGPGKIINYDEIVVSADCVAADAYCVAEYEWYGRKMKPGNVGYIKESVKRGLGRMDLENLIIKKETI